MDSQIKHNDQKHCRFFNTKNGCKKGEDCEFSHISKPSGGKSCKFFTTKDGCSKGDSCTFLHTAAFSTPKFQDPSNVPCKFGSGCKKGDACAFMHQVNQNNSLKQVPCKFGDACNKGNACLFSHTQKC